MKIQPKKVSIRELFDGFKDDGADGIVGFGGRLNIRPPYQREFIYDDADRDKVIDTVRKGFPLNVMYWVRNPDREAPEDDSRASFEVLDGQQRTLSICKYVNGDFSFKAQYFHGLPEDIREAILGYELSVYVCEGKPSEKLEWFGIVNIAAKRLTEQELRNAVYTGQWLTDAKKRFSKPNCPAYLLASKYVSGSPIRQELLELALNWISEGDPRAYMAKHQYDENAEELWNHFSNVINWVKATFTTVRKEMKSVDWGHLYVQHKDDKTLDPEALEKRVEELMRDDDVTKKHGIYAYVLDGDERHLSVRAFSENMKREAFTRQKGICNNRTCPKAEHAFKIEEMEADHIDPWHSGGKTIASNCQMLCKQCNRRKGGK